jgi:choline dehydrogenase-like flavoprotein
LTERAEVLVVGAGASGGVVARRLARAGFAVVCLEQGRWHDRSEFPARRPEFELLARKQWTWSPNERGRPEDYPVNADDSDIVPVMFNGVGGSTILFGGDWARLHPSDFRVRTLDGVADDWPISYEELLPYYEQTDAEFGVSGLGGNPAFPPGAAPPLPPLPIGPAALRVARAHVKLDWHWWPGTNSVLSAPYGGRRPCSQWSACFWGCPSGAKASTDATHWPDAIEHGARVVTGARVRRLLLGPQGLATGVEYVTEDGREHVQEAEVVVLAANGIGTARLLLLSAGPGHPDGLANGSGLVGRRLMLHPFAYVMGLFDEPLRSWNGHHMKIVSYEFYETDESRGHVRGAKWGMPATGGPVNAALTTRAGVSQWGADHHLNVRSQLGRDASWVILSEDLPNPDNTVTLDPELTDSSGVPAPKVTYRVAENSWRLLDFHIERATESLLAAGAEHVQAHRLMRGWGGHLLGTARMGNGPETSVVDRFGRAHEVENLYVVDGSVFPTAGGANPTSTIVALAARTADHLIETRRRQKVPA